MEYGKNNLNGNLISLSKKLSNKNIENYITSENSIEIYFNNANKDLVLNMLSQLNKDKTSFEFKTSRNGGNVKKAVNVIFNRNLGLNCEYMNGYLDSKYTSSNINRFSKIDIILDSFPYDNTTLMINLNKDMSNGILVNINQFMTSEEMLSENNIAKNSEELNHRIIHEVSSKVAPDLFNTTYGLYYQDEADLDNLLTIKNTKKITKANTKKLILTLDNKKADLN